MRIVKWVAPILIATVLISCSTGISNLCPAHQVERACQEILDASEEEYQIIADRWEDHFKETGTLDKQMWMSWEHEGGHSLEYPPKSVNSILSWAEFLHTDEYKVVLSDDVISFVYK